MKEFDLKQFLKKYRNKSVDFFRFPGNYGDSLIWHGTKNLFSELIIDEKYVDINSSRYNNTLLIDGGGNFVDYYSDIRDFLIKKSFLYNEVIILPHTIFGDEQIRVLNNISSKLVIFCREEISVNFLNNKIKNANVYTWHDCAFYNNLVQEPKGSGELNAFRLDKESRLQKLPSSNKDISLKGYATKPLDEFIDKIYPYKQVNTDRLHVAICAVLLGKKVKLYANSYYKNKAVFNYSLKNYNNIEFIDN